MWNKIKNLKPVEVLFAAWCFGIILGMLTFWLVFKVAPERQFVVCGEGWIVEEGELQPIAKRVCLAGE